MYSTPLTVTNLVSHAMDKFPGKKWPVGGQFLISIKKSMVTILGDIDIQNLNISYQDIDRLVTREQREV